MNSNLFHNIANVLIAVVGLATALLLTTGCVSTPAGGLDCSASWISPTLSGWIVGGLGVLKLLVNVIRDGVAGLTKTQPPVE